MSYDYHALVQEISRARRQAAQSDSLADELECLSQALAAFDTLSTHCPMTPLLWIQHAQTARDLLVLSSSAAETETAANGESDDLMQDNDDNNDNSAWQTQLDVLELGLQEFPGSALLQLYFAECVLQSPTMALDDKQTAIASVLSHVGRGSHLSEDYFLERLFDIHLLLAQQQQDSNTALIESLLLRSKSPLASNDSLEQRARELLSSQLDPTALQDVLHQMAQNRQAVAKAFSSLYTHGDDINMSLHQLGILAKHQLPMMTSENRIDWKRVALSGDQLYGMGLGDRTVAHAMIQYALAVQAILQKGAEGKQVEEEVEDDDSINDEPTVIHRDLVMVIFERAVAECPTVESLWLSYIRHLTELLTAKQDEASVISTKLQSVATRACRNCPDSLHIAQQKLWLSFHLSKLDCQIIDPEALLETAQASLVTKFLPNEWQHLRLYLTSIRVVKQRILWLLAPKTAVKGGTVVDYDDGEPQPTKKKGASSQPPSDDVFEELHDLMDDLPDMYQQVEECLKAAFPKWPAGISLLWKDRAQTALWLLDDLRRLKNDHIPPEKSQDKDALYWFETALRTSTPSHPDMHRNFISAYAAQSTGVANESDVARRIRHVRFFYQRALKSVGRARRDDDTAEQSTEPSLQRDFDSAFSCLCHEWLEFEHSLGSDRSIGRATHAIQTKMRKLQIQLMDGASSGSKRKYSDDATNMESHVAKKSKVVDNAQLSSSITDVSANVAADTTVASKTNDCKVKVGNLEYPAHPFTVRISFLSPATDDVDLVDLLRPKCGTIAHARIVRDKHPPHISKGWGLVQFEEKESVEKALALNDVIGLHEKVLRIERSHLPAISLVPPGRHKVNEKGQGKHSKQNEKKHQQVPQKPKETGIADMEVEKSESIKDEPKSEKKPVPAAANANPLSFQPRGVARHSRQKPKLKLS